MPPTQHSFHHDSVEEAWVRDVPGGASAGGEDHAPRVCGALRPHGLPGRSRSPQGVFDTRTACPHDSCSCRLFSLPAAPLRHRMRLWGVRTPRDPPPMPRAPRTPVCPMRPPTRQRRAASSATARPRSPPGAVSSRCVRRRISRARSAETEARTASRTDVPRVPALDCSCTSEVAETAPTTCPAGERTGWAALADASRPSRTSAVRRR